MLFPIFHNFGIMLIHTDTCKHTKVSHYQTFSILCALSLFNLILENLDGEIAHKEEIKGIQMGRRN